MCDLVYFLRHRLPAIHEPRVCLVRLVLLLVTIIDMLIVHIHQGDDAYSFHMHRNATHSPFTL